TLCIKFRKGLKHACKVFDGNNVRIFSGIAKKNRFVLYMLFLKNIFYAQENFPQLICSCRKTNFKLKLYPALCSHRNIIKDSINDLLVGNGDISLLVGTNACAA